MDKAIKADVTVVIARLKETEPLIKQALMDPIQRLEAISGTIQTIMNTLEESKSDDEDHEDEDEEIQEDIDNLENVKTNLDETITHMKEKFVDEVISDLEEMIK